MQKTLHVVVASKNPVKVQATRDAFSLQFPGSSIEIEPVNAISGVSDQPVGDEETRRGARNRVANIRNRYPDADYWVGLEGGIEALDGQLMAFAWMAAEDRAGKTGSSRTVTLPLPPAVKELVDSGMELGDANDRVFSTLNSKQSGGAFGLLTNGLHTRESVYTQALTIALVPFVNKQFGTSA